MSKSLINKRKAKHRPKHKLGNSHPYSKLFLLNDLGSSDSSCSDSARNRSLTKQYNEVLPQLEAEQAAKTGTPGTLYDPIFAPDNFTAPNFLSELSRNPYPHEMEIYNIILKGGRFVIQLCAGIIFHILYYHLVNETMEPGGVMFGCFLTCSFGYVYAQLLPAIRAAQSPSLSDFPQYFPKEHLKLIAVYLLFSYQFAPVLRTLTASISTNTIHYISAITLFLHLLTTNYGMESFVTSRTLSVNSAVVGSICLTSRLASNYHSLALLSLAVETFVLFPMFSACVWDSLIILILFIIVTGVGLLTISAGLFLFYSFIIFLALGVIPMLLLYGIQFKNNIYGPWDEAVLEPYISPNTTPRSMSEEAVNWK